MPDDQYTLTHLVKHRINTGNQAPIQQRQYPVPSIAQEFVKNQVSEMKANGFIRPSNSPWRLPVCITKKKTNNGQLDFRFCLDQRAVNEISAKDSYPLPLIAETKDALGGSVIFSAIDVERAFWQIEIEEEDKCKTAFLLNNELLEFNVMVFGDKNSPSTFQRLMNKVLNGMTWIFCLVYIDDILIYSRSFEQHLIHIEQVLEALIRANIKLKLSKCLFGTHEVNYLGFRITERGVQPSLEKIEAMIRVPPPKTPKLLYNFLCGVNYYRSLIPNFGKISVQLYHMTESKKNFKWTDETLKTYADLKQKLVEAPILAFPDFSLPFYIECDASDFAIGSQLLQKQGNLLRPLGFAGRKLTQTEQNYSVSEKELLAVVYAYDKFYHYVFGRKIIFFTDHKPLVTAKQLKKPFGRLGRLFLKISEADYEIVYKPGSVNYIPDFLSRVYPEDKVCSVNMTRIQSSIDWVSEQSKDETLKRLVELVNRNNSSVSDWSQVDNGDRWFHERRQLYLSGNILKHSSNLIVCPKHLRLNILKLHHDVPLAVHRAFETTYQSIKSRYFWIFMPRDVKNYCQSCLKCQQFNYTNMINRAPLKPIVTTRAFQTIGIDFMGPFKETRRGNKYVILAADHYVKYLEGRATTSFTAEITGQFIFEDIVCRHGPVEQILSDKGVNFESKLIKHLSILCGTEKLHSSNYHPEGNGAIERVNKSIKPYLAKMVNDDQDDWDLYLPMAISTYNNSFHSTIKMSPYEALYARKPVLVADVILNNQLPANTRLADVSNFICGLRRSAESISKIIARNTIEAQQRQKQYYDRFTRNRVKFEIGDSVLIFNYRTRIGFSKAFEPKLLGPFVVKRILGDLNYEIESAVYGKEIVHYNRMQKCLIRNQNFPNTVAYEQNRETKSHSTQPEKQVNLTNDANINLLIEIKRLKRARALSKLEGDRIERENIVVCSLESLFEPSTQTDEANSIGNGFVGPVECALNGRPKRNVPVVNYNETTFYS